MKEEERKEIGCRKEEGNLVIVGSGGRGEEVGWGEGEGGLAGRTSYLFL